jgi:hypothetical protein
MRNRTLIGVGFVAFMVLAAVALKGQLRDRHRKALGRN